MSFNRRASLQQFHRANHQQNYRPGAAKVQVVHMQVLQQEQDADGKNHRWTHQPPRAAARTLAA